MFCPRTATRRCWLWDRFRRSVFNMTGMEPGQNGSMSLSTYIYTGALRRGQINRGSLGKWGGSGSFAFRLTTISFQWIQQGSLCPGSNKDLSTLDPTRISLPWIQEGSLSNGSKKDPSIWFNKDQAGMGWDPDSELVLINEKLAGITSVTLQIPKTLVG